MFPSTGQAAKFMQIYFLSQADQFTTRRSIFDGLNPDLIRDLTAMLNEVNSYVAQFKSAVSTIRNSTTPNLKVNTCKQHIQIYIIILYNSKLYFCHISHISLFLSTFLIPTNNWIN